VEDEPCLSSADALACTADLCSAEHQCVPEFLPGFCLIDGVCRLTGALQEGNRCLICDPARNAAAWSDLICEEDPCLTSSCHPASGCSSTPINCNDNNACTADFCQPPGGCRHSAINCSDGVACTADSCSALNGCAHDDSGCECDEANDPVCNDGKACSVDSCNMGALSCVHPAGPDDGEEENDTRTAAAPLAGGLADLVLTDKDDDWYWLSVCEGGEYTFTAEFAHADGNLNLYLVDADGLVLVAAQSTDDDETIEWTATFGGTVYVRALLPAEGCVDYSLAVDADESACCDAGGAPIACDEQIAGDTTGQADDMDEYSCAPLWDESGPDARHPFDAPCDGWTTVKLTPNADDELDLFVLDGCAADDCLDYASSGGAATEIVFLAREGQRYFFAVDGEDAAGGLYSLEVECACNSCADNDSDSHNGYHPIDCPLGDDCNDNNGNVYPGATETACDGVDNDCAGGDDCGHYACADDDTDGYPHRDPNSCPMGTDCNDDNEDVHPGADDATCDGVDQNCDGMDNCPGTGVQCDACFFDFGCAPGFMCMISEFDVFEFVCLRDCTADGRCPEGSNCLDTGELSLCWPEREASCVGNFLHSGNTCGVETSVTDCEAATCNPDAGVCEAACGAAEGPLACGQTVTDHTARGASLMNNYDCRSLETGPEVIYTYTAACTGRAAASLSVLTDSALDLLVLQGTCDNAHCLAVSPADGYRKEVIFPTAVGATYYLVVDGQEGDQGRYSLGLDCVCNADLADHCEDCDTGLDCGGGALCYGREMQQDPPVNVCAADCSTDGVCPAGSQCRAFGAGAYHCVPDLTAFCADQELWGEDACGNQFLLTVCPAGSVCDASSLTCDTSCVDQDNDGYFAYHDVDCPAGDDCNDALDTFHPGAADAYCNGQDEDCSGADNCTDAAQCEPCVGGHCAPGYRCWNWWGDEDYRFCIKDCTADYECSDEYDLACADWESGTGEGPFYCQPEDDENSACAAGRYTQTDGCGHVFYDEACDVTCYSSFGCVNYCDSDVEIDSCGQTISGDTSSDPLAEFRTTYYYNSDYTRTSATGPELSYKFISPCSGEISARIVGEFGLLLLIIDELGGHCRNSELVDYAWSDGGEVVTWLADAGEHFYLVVDGLDGYAGPYDIELQCACSDCLDVDNDTYLGYDPVDCPGGTDCNDGLDTFHPGATETSCNGLDEDCDGFDLCGVCNVDHVLAACDGSTVAGDNRGQTNEITYYEGPCSFGGNNYAIPAGEEVFAYTAACNGTLTATISGFDIENTDLMLYILEGDCADDACLGRANWDQVTVDTLAGETYYVVVDGYGGAGAAFQLTTDCACYNCVDVDNDTYFAHDAEECPMGDDCNDGLDSIHPEATETECDGVDQDCSGHDLCANPICTQDAVITCASGTVPGDITGQPNQIWEYSGCSSTWMETGGEVVYAFAATCTGLVTVEVEFDPGDEYQYDLDLFVLDGTCDAASCMEYGDESVVFSAVTGTTYYVVVDDYDNNPTTFDLSISCGCR